MKGWYGDRFEHSLASKGIRLKLNAYGLTADQKWDYNYNKLQGSYSHYFIYVPVQFGNLSSDKRKVKNLGHATIKGEDGVIGRATLLQIVQPHVGAGRKMIWWEKREDKPREDGTYWWNYGFDSYNKGRWEFYMDEMKRNKQEMGHRW